MLLENKTVFITGAGRGIGQGVAQATIQEGAKVVITDQNMSSLETTISLLKSISAEVLALEVDVTDNAQIEAGMQRTVEHFGSLDGLVNNAGVAVLSPSLYTPKADMVFQFDVNVMAVFECCQCAAKFMKEQPDGGRIVNIASNAGKVGYPGYVPYSASKAAVVNMTQTLAKEWADYRINVNAVCPGGVDTPMLTDVARSIAAKTGGDAVEIRKSMYPSQIGRHIQPLEVGRIVVFLLSDYAQIIRGQSISIDGGETPF